ncbi:Rpn family recombination-promoting nuclease/putative transposase [uncultured Acetatifactor sp.]|uniref:Rpn family recombination-promoting nuclease/putative transposase n=1 Tax=uncultured Acetatifactor sp. TaxID=1671927 RepID=UPI00272BA96B|nr:Rpn family recombination-promoting nuclease/putative transposase [uncultured Acetatifactor sp.]
MGKDKAMAEKDIAEKTLEAYDDVFADIINVLLFQGRQFVKEDELEEESLASSYKADGRLHAQERDVAKYWRKGLVRIALYGLENQTAIDGDMPLRLFSYDGAAYRAQLLTDREMKEKTGRTAPRYPVVTLVLYFGYDRHWKRPKTLFECLDIPEEIKPYVNDHRMNLYEVAYLSDEQVEMFTSDFKVVADYFVQMRKNKNYVASEVTIKHVHELLQLMAVMTQDSRFEDVYSPDMERREMTMCEVLDRVENKGIQKGEDTILSLMNYLLSNNRTEDAKKATEDKAYRNKLLTEIFGEK